jgi:hypothetical protein
MSPATEQQRSHEEQPMQASRSSTTSPDLTNWARTPGVTVEFRQNYGLELLVAPCGKAPQFKLMPKYLLNGYEEETIVQFNLTFEEGRMLPNWEELLFTPLGFLPPQLGAKLPPWSPDQEPVYAKILDPLVTELYRKDTQIRRLEANIPLYLNHSPESKRLLTIDRVRMVYLEDVVEGPNPNYVLIEFTYLDGYKVMQNGCGGGPPN